LQKRRNNGSMTGSGGLAALAAAFVIVISYSSVMPYAA
jgi:uncharacterized membrane protein